MNKPDRRQRNYSRWLVIFCLVFAGEMIFSLPFHVIRIFRPTLLEVFNLTNTEVGDSMAVYGIMAMIAYFPGGTLADRFSPRKLMSLSLLATGLGGLYFALIPGHLGLSVVFGWWGVTTIFLFWAAMIKSTREWGGTYTQGMAFGLLDGGRGLIAAGAATLAVFILSAQLPENLETATTDQKREALSLVIYFYTFLTMLAALLVWLFISDSTKEGKVTDRRLLKHLKQVLTNKMVWLQAIIVVCAYSAYKGLEYYTLYAVDVLGINEVDAAFWMSNALYIRAFSAFAAGVIVDRFSASRVISVLFLGLVLCYFMLGSIAPDGNIK
jgi:nitrate/nitrite transporter NarK